MYNEPICGLYRLFHPLTDSIEMNLHSGVKNFVCKLVREILCIYFYSERIKQLASIKLKIVRYEEANR